MRSLFLRIFLYFWLAMGLILAGGVLVATVFIGRQVQTLQRLDLTELAAGAEKHFVTEGRRGLKKWVADTERQHAALWVYVVDVATSRDVLGRNLPEFLSKRVQLLARGGVFGDPRFGRLGPPMFDPLRGSARINGPDGKVYLLMLSLRPQLSMIGTPDVQLMLFTIALTISGLICWVLTRSVTRPVTLLQSAVRSVTAGDLDTRVGNELAGRSDELGVLARDFDQMAERLRVLLKSKEVLLRDISHELRTPLARLRLALGLARRQGADLEREHDRIEREAERLDELIGEVLHLSRLTTAQPMLSHAKFDFAQLVADIVEDARLEATAQGKDIVWRSQGPTQIDADEELLRRGVENVLRNAVRFTPSGSNVELHLQRTPEQVMLTVRDHGPGVPETDLPRLFEPFYRVAQARERDSGGYGLGLAITAQVFALHAGAAVARNAPGGGLVVTLTVPMKFVPATAA